MMTDGENCQKERTGEEDERFFLKLRTAEQVQFYKMFYINLQCSDSF